MRLQAPDLLSVLAQPMPEERPRKGRAKAEQDDP